MGFFSFCFSAMPPQTKPSSFPTLPEIKSKLPKDCFKSSLPLSLYYVARSAILVVLLFVSVYSICSPASPYYVQNESVRSVAWALYWFIQGTIFWGIFVLGHDCGHSSFSRYDTINYIFGNLLHSFILVPYESWKTTHRIHHKNTGNIDKDEIFYPHREDNSYNLLSRLFVGLLSIAWMVYIIGTRHLSPFEEIYIKSRLAVTGSIACWAVFVAGFVYSCFVFGVVDVACYYFIPLLVFMAWLVITTFLHHQDVDAPWYGNKEWTYVKGNLSSIDRSYGYVIDNLIHNIGTHQIHHLFPKIPHYKLKEATVAFREAYPCFVRKTNESNIPAFVNNWIIYCKYALAPPGTEYFCYRDVMAQDQCKKTS